MLGASQTSKKRVDILKLKPNIEMNLQEVEPQEPITLSETLNDEAFEYLAGVLKFIFKKPFNSPEFQRKLDAYIESIQSQPNISPENSGTISWNWTITSVS